MLRVVAAIQSTRAMTAGNRWTPFQGNCRNSAWVATKARSENRTRGSRPQRLSDASIAGAAAATRPMNTGPATTKFL